MPRSLPPRALESPDDAEWLTIDSGWSTVPPGPTRQQEGASRSLESDRAQAASARGSAESQDSTAAAEGKASRAKRSRKPRARKKGRAHGTLLGVAPPTSPEQAASSGGSPIVVRAGSATRDAAPAAADSVHRGARPAMLTRGIVEGPNDRTESSPVKAISVAAPPKPQRRPPALPTTSQAAESEPGATPTAETPSVGDICADQANTFGPRAAPNVVLPRRHADAPSLGEAMASRVRFAGAEVPLWHLMAPLFGLLLAAITAMAVAGTSRAQEARSAERSGGSLASLSARKQIFPPTAQRAPEIGVLESRPRESLSADEVLLVTRVIAERDRETARTLRERLARDPSTVKDKVTLTQLRKLAMATDTADIALGAIAALPGPLSADLLYEVWTAAPNHPEGIELAQALLFSRDVRGKATDALSVALELHLAQDCLANRDVLARAVGVGDRRSLPLLKRLKARVGCGRNEKQDCYPCLRPRSALDAAIAAVKSRPAPSPFDAL